MENIKREGECCCCFSKEDLFSLSEPYNFEENVKIYSTMIAECFQIELSSYIEECDRYLYLICSNCVLRLRDAIMLRSQVRIVYDRLQAKYCKKDNLGDTSNVYSEAINMKENILNNGTSNLDEHCCKEEKIEEIPIEYSDIAETKENILKYDISECNMDVDSGASSSNENVPTGEHLLEKLKKTDVKSHMFFCNICGEAFSCQQTFDKHILRHSVEKSYKCDVCEKTFVTRTALGQHVKLHFNPNLLTSVTANKPTEKTKRQRISLETKIKILERLNCGEKIAELSKEYELNESTIRTIKRNESKIRNRVSIGSSACIDQIVRVKNNLIARVENKLAIWLEDCHKKDVPLSTHMIRRKAIDFFVHFKESEDDSESNQTRFIASQGWFEGFKKRYSLRNVKIQEESKDTDAIE